MDIPDNDPKDVVNYASQTTAEETQLGFFLPLIAWAGTVTFFVFFFIGTLIAAAGGSRALVGICLLCCLLGSGCGFFASVFGMRGRSTGRIGLGIGMVVNGAILCLYLFLIIRTLLQ